jgi:uncharacterized RDD family membrane protein YckC
MPIEVQTTQNVTIDYEPAGLGYRILAYLVDWVIIIAWIIGWYAIIWGLFSNSWGFYMDSWESLYIFTYVIILFPMVFYDLLFEVFNNGQTPGKMIFKIRVVSLNGTSPTIGGYLLRWLFRLVDIWMSYGLLAIIMIAVTGKAQRLGDMIGGTTVIDMKPSSKNKELTLADLDFHEDYKVTYSDVLDKLSDRDIQTILAIMEDHNMQNNDYFRKRLADRIKDITGYSYNGPDHVFLNKVVSDYNYLALQ